MDLRLLLPLLLASFLHMMALQGKFYTSIDELPYGIIIKQLQEMSIVTCLLLCENEKLCDRAMFKKRLNQRGDCWLIQENTTDAGEEMQRLREDESIESFKTLLRKVR